MSLSKDDILELMQKAKELGLKHVKLDGFEASFEDLRREVPTQVIPDATFEELIAPQSPFDDLSEDEIQYFATPYFDEIQANKAKREQELKEETRATGRKRSRTMVSDGVQKGTTQ